MIGISAIAHYLPDGLIDNANQALKFNEPSSFARDRLGCSTLPVKALDEETSDLAHKAVLKLLAKIEIEKEDIDCLVVCTQNPDGSGLPHTSAIVQSKVGLSKNVAAFDISLGCSGYVYGLNIVKGFMDAAGLKYGVLVTADPYSKIIDRDDRNTTMLFGDAATATLLTTENAVFEIGPSLYSTDGTGSDNLINNNGTLFMNGRQVFNFASKNVPIQVKELIRSAGLELDDLDLALLHQGSRHIVQTLARRLGLSNLKVPCSIENTGNTVSSSLPLLLEDVIENSSVNNLLISGFGVGLSWGSMLLYRIQK